MVDFTKFDKEVNQEELNKDVNKAVEDGGFEDVPKGTYICSLEKMELGATKSGGKPMFTMSMKILEGEHKGRLIFFNRVIYGNTSEKWTDAKAIASVITILEKFETETKPEFINYSSFADNILDIYEELQGKVEVEIDYDAKSFNSISIKEIYDV